MECYCYEIQKFSVSAKRISGEFKGASNCSVTPGGVLKRQRGSVSMGSVMVSRGLCRAKLKSRQ